jgi:ABC-type sugar transport system ATPase subunit
MLLETKNLKKYFSKVKAVDGVDLMVEEGECLGFLGPNGAGKSTTISMIATLIKPTEGQVFYRGDDISKHPKTIQRELGYVPQEIALYPTLSGKDNLVFWGRAYGLRGSQLKERLKEVSDIVGINERLKDKVKKAVTDHMPEHLPVLSQTGLPDRPDYFIYPYKEEFRGQIDGEIVDLNLTDIVTAFIGGEYA